MRKVITSAFVSLDGVMQAPGGPEEDPTGGFTFGGWIVPYIDDGVGTALTDLFTAPFDLLLGRKTYEIFAAHWPYQSENDPIVKRFNAVTTYVATRSHTSLTWKGSVALSDAATNVARLRQEDGPHLITQGSSDLIRTLLAHDLIDEFIVFTVPIILGHGKWLFSTTARPAAWQLEDTTHSTTGVTISSYQRAGAVTTGDFTRNPPTALELARREHENVGPRLAGAKSGMYALRRQLTSERRTGVCTMPPTLQTRCEMLTQRSGDRATLGQT